MVAGRFWCSYARASLTQTAPVRPRGCVCVRVQACVQACTLVCVPIGGVWRCAVVWCAAAGGCWVVWWVWWVVWCGAIPLLLYLSRWRWCAFCAGGVLLLGCRWVVLAYLFFSLVAGACLFRMYRYVYRYVFVPVFDGVVCCGSSCSLAFPPLSASLTPLLLISMTIKNVI